ADDCALPATKQSADRGATGRAADYGSVPLPPVAVLIPVCDRLKVGRLSSELDGGHKDGVCLYGRRRSEGYMRRIVTHARSLTNRQQNAKSTNKIEFGSEIHNSSYSFLYGAPLSPIVQLTYPVLRSRSSRSAVICRSHLSPWPSAVTRRKRPPH